MEIVAVMSVVLVVFAFIIGVLSGLLRKKNSRICMLEFMLERKDAYIDQTVIWLEQRGDQIKSLEGELEAELTKRLTERCVKHGRFIGKSPLWEGHCQLCYDEQVEIEKCPGDCGGCLASRCCFDMARGDGVCNCDRTCIDPDGHDAGCLCRCPNCTGDARTHGHVTL